MNRKKLESAIQRLQGIFQSKTASTLHDKIETCFGRLVLDECATLFKRFQAEDDARFSLRVQALLKDTYELVHNTFLFYTAMPTSEMTLLLCDLSAWVAQTTHQPIITILMPSIATDSLQEEYPDLTNDDIDIRWILQTHILGDDGLHLVPVRLLTKLDLNPVQEPIGTPYTNPDRSHEREAYFVSPEELSRMGKYSELSSQLLAEKVRYFKLQNNNNALYSELTILCQSLWDNSVRGRGTEYNAGNDVYPAIFHFGEFYKTLKKDNPILIQRLSTGLKQEIERILNLVSTRSTSDNAVERCIAIRRTQLMHAMSQSEALTNTEDLRVNIQQSAAQFEQLKTRLTESLTQEITTRRFLPFSRHSPVAVIGRDPLTITASLLQNLNVLNILGVQNDAGLLSKLFRGATTTPLEELKQLLTPLPLELRTIFLTSMGNNLVPLIQSIQDFVFVATLSSQQQAALIFNEIIKPRLGTLLNSTKDLKAIRRYLSESEHCSILNDLKDRLPTIWLEVKHEAKIEQVKVRALSQLKEKIKQQWLAYQTNRERTTLEGSRLSAIEKEQIVRERIQTHAQHFEHTYTRVNTDLFFQQIDKLSPGRLMLSLFKRHPWIAIDPESTLVESFLTDTLVEQLYAGFNPNCANWDWLKRNTPLNETHLTWRPVSETQLNAWCEGYPLSDLQNLYLNQPLPQYASFDQQMRAMFVDLEQFTRIDVLRILAHRYPRDVKSVMINEIHCIKITPLHIDELKHLLPKQLQYIETLLINIRTEDRPFWMLLHRTPNHWIAYMPPEELAYENPLIKLRSTLPNIIQAELDFSDNIELNHMPQLNALSIWHTLLLGRVLPGCRQTNQHLPMFRQTAPVSLMLQQLVMNSLQRSALFAPKLREIFRLETYSGLFKASGPYQLALNAPLYVTNLLNQLDTQNFVLSKNSQNEWQLTINKANCSIDEIHQAFCLLFNFPISHLVFTPGLFFSQELATLFDYNVHLKTIRPLIAQHQNNTLFNHATECAARNRICATVDGASNDMSRDMLWNKFAGIILKQYFQILSSLPASAPIFQDISETGITGINALFSYIDGYYSFERWNRKHIGLSPRLKCTFNLSGNPWANESANYIHTLAEKISSTTSNRPMATPLFASWSFMLPQAPNAKDLEQFIHLIGVMDRYHSEHPNEPDEVILHLVAIDNPWISKLLKELYTSALNGNLRIILRIPEWDETVYSKPDQNRVKSDYYLLQNQVLDNQRRHRSKVLPQYTTSLDALTKNTLNPEILLSNKLTPQTHTWAGEDISYPLSGSLSVQQQHVQAQEHQLQQERKPAPTSTVDEEETIELIKAYTGNEDNLLGRESGIENFSMWVGSDRNATHVIEKMEDAAVKKLNCHAYRFKQGLVPENLPAGFYLARSLVSHGLILCFDSKREIDELKQSNRPRNPFKIVLRNAKAVAPLRGDFRQLQTLRSTPKDQQCLLAYLSGLEQTVTPASFNECIQCLRQWALDLGATEPFVQSLFATLTPSNLAAFGQLFNQYDVQSTTVNGTQYWLKIAQNIFDAFPETAFFIWKKRMLDASDNWASCLEKEEVDAVTLSIITLQKSPQASKIWWALVDAHGHATGRMYYSDIWFAYQKLLHYVDNHNLVLHDGQFLQYLEKVGERFDGQTFLNRLYRVLKNTETKLQTRDIAQSLLDNIAHIDWCHNGFYYASQYELYPYWDNDLQLYEWFTSCADGYQVPWDPADTITAPITHALRFACQRMQLPFSQFKRFKALLMECAGQRTLSPVALRLFCACLSIGSDTLDQLSTTQCLEFFSEIDCMDPALLSLINAQFELDEALQPNTIQLRLTDFEDFADALDDVPAFKSQLSSPNAKSFLNACGRALQSGANLTDLFKLIKDEKDYDVHPLLTTYPWLTASYDEDQDPIQEAFDSLERLAHMGPAFKPRYVENQRTIISKQLDRFQQQLQSINFKESSTLPTQTGLNDLIEDIIFDPKPAAIRRAIVATLISHGCAITYQDTRFRRLTLVEINTAMTRLERALELTFRSQNLPLCKRFLEHHLTLETEGHFTIQLQDCIDLLIQIDNKVNYNELGHVLGALLAQANQKTKRFYSAPQLNVWLSSLINEQTYHQYHFPIPIFNQLLVSEQSETLLNANLNALSGTDSVVGLKKLVQDIMATSLPMHAQLALCTLVFKQNPDLDYILQAKGILLATNTPSSDRISRLIIWAAGSSVEARTAILNLLTAHPNGYTSATTELKTQWVHSQAKLIDLLLEGQLASSSLYLFKADDIQKKTAYIRIILIQSCPKPITEKGSNIALLSDTLELQNHEKRQGLKRELSSLQQHLQSWDIKQLHTLISYLADYPGLSSSQLNQLVSPFHKVLIKNPWTWHPDSSKASDFDSKVFEPTTNADEVIHRFESILQAQDANQNSKRHYSITPQDSQSLLRVVTGMKQKGLGFLTHDEQATLLNLLHYTNSYTLIAGLSECRMTKLLEELNESLAENSDYAHARVLACIREIVLRKTGLWANHTQMLDLLYAASRPNGSLLHQLQTGEGKTIITAMRVAYLALNGFVIDVFSAKESLSHRDFQEFAPAFKAMSIPHAFITAHSKASIYHDRKKNKLGAIHYTTLGNFSLFIQRHSWEGNVQFQMKNWFRIAFLDEADNILIDDETQFNFSDNGKHESAYNLDEWVYRAAYDFYLDNKATFSQDPQSKTIFVSKNIHLKALCDHLQRHAISAPDESTFLAEYIIPALNNDTRAVEKRNNQLLLLLSATHKAYLLQEGIHYCIRPELKTIGKQAISIRFAKVLIDNQIREDSTYSELVHQALHVRLNIDAAEKGEDPDFFVDPVSQVVLSQNAPFILKTYYLILEGCTATPGNSDALMKYEIQYGIQDVVKLPTHKERRSQHFPTCYCQDEAEQLQIIAQYLLENRNRPILVTCKDDIAVKHLSRGVQALLTKQSLVRQIIVDTNDSGKLEMDIVPMAGEDGAITFSARMGRGTDIKPSQTTEEGLMVIRTYPATSRIAKQDLGRQGRNGAPGSHIDILNYGQIQLDDELYSSNPHTRSRLTAIKEEQLNHFEQKLKKYEQLKREYPWERVEDMKNYLITRSIELLKDQMKQEQKMFTQRKHELVAYLNERIIDGLKQYDVIEQATERRAIQVQWIDVYNQIESAWSKRLEGQFVDTETIYQAFLDRVVDLCKPLMAVLDTTGIEAYESDTPIHWRFDPFTHVENQRKPRASLPIDDSVAQDKEDLEAQQAFYQWWYQGAQMAYSDALAYQGDTEALEQFNQVLKALYISANSTARAALFKALQTVMDYRSGFTVSLTSLADAIPLLAAKFNDDDYDNYLACFTAFFSHTWLNHKKASEQTPDDIKKISLLFRVSMKIITTNTISTPEKLSQLNQFVFDLNAIIKDTYWNDWHISPLAYGIHTIFAKTPAVASLLAQNTSQEQLGRYLQLIKTDVNSIRTINLNLHLYLEQEMQALSDNPSIIPYLFELAMAGITMPSLIDALPTILCIPEANTESHEHLWSFLSKRTPIHQADSQKLVTILNSDRFDTEKRQRIMAVLNTLPPYVSLKYINEQLSSNKSWRTSLSEVDASGRALCLFLRARGLVTSIDHFTHPTDQAMENWNHFMACFDRTTPERNVSFFTLINSDEFKDVELNQLKKLASYYSTDSTVTLDQIQQILRFGNKIPNIPGTISSAIQRYYNDHLETNFHTLLDPNGKFSQFLDLLIGKNVALPETMFLTLYVPWKENRIDRFVLAKSLDVSKTAVALHKDRNWQDYFSSMDKNKIARQDMMQHLTCGLLNLGQDFDRECHANYTLFARKIIASQLSQNKSHPFKFVMQLITEIKTIASNLYQAATVPIATHERQSRDNHSYLAYQKLRQYRGCFMFWGRTQDRKDEADRFYLNISGINDRHREKESYYPALLTTIIETQERILTDDKDCGYTRNRSGASRLYNITTELFATVLQDYLLDEHLSMANKAAVYDICRRQLKSHLSILNSRLAQINGVNTQLIQLIHNVETKIPTDPSQLWAPQDVTVRKLKIYLDNNPKCIPKHLRYLLSPINLLCEMSDAPSEYASSTL